MDHSTLQRARLRDALIFNMYFAIPALAQGLFIRRPRIVRWVALLRRRFDASSWIDELNHRYGPGGVRMPLGFQPHHLLLGETDLQNTLHLSPRVFGVPASKRKGMNHFQPNALSISEGESWIAGRRLNEQALETGCPSDSLTYIADVVRDACDSSGLLSADTITWANVRDLFEQIALRLIFGESGEREREISRQLTVLLRRANSSFLPRKVTVLRRMAQDIRAAISRAPLTSMAGRLRIAAASSGIPPETQIPHWLFAIRDTLPENLARTLIVLASNPGYQHSIRIESRGGDAGESASMARACILETMRLWPSTPFIVRQPLQAYPLLATLATPRMPLVIANEILHRDRSKIEDADKFIPERWLGGFDSWFVNSFSRGTQECPGSHIALGIGTVFIKSLVAARELYLLAPRFESGGKSLSISMNPYELTLRVEGLKPKI